MKNISKYNSIVFSLFVLLFFSDCSQSALNQSNKPANKATPSPSVDIGNSPMPKPTMEAANAVSNSAKPTSNSNRKPAGQPPVAVTEKKSDSLFSFPPPQPVDSAEIPNQFLTEGISNPTFSTVAKVISDKLEKANYTRGKYSYFWNTENEFAIVTKMERINIDGTPFLDSSGVVDARWEINDYLPTAENSGEYFRYLIGGKKVFYRVFAFIVTNKDYSFFDNSPPSFEMAQKWKRLGNSGLGVGATSTVKEIEFTDQYHCFALLYLFVNHTSLDSPLAVNSLEKADEALKDNLNTDALDNLKSSQVWGINQ
jgi:hypothetical protein